MKWKFRCEPVNDGYTIDIPCIDGVNAKELKFWKIDDGEFESHLITWLERVEE